MITALISHGDLDDELVECLPDRETLHITINVSPVIGVNLAVAVNAATINSVASAFASQQLTGILN
jgi:hypothetical protein